MAEAPAAVQAAGGEYLVRGGKFEVMEGHWQPARIAIASSRPRPSTTVRCTVRRVPNGPAPPSSSTWSWSRA
jgi:hypothetical protein